MFRMTFTKFTLKMLCGAILAATIGSQASLAQDAGTKSMDEAMTIIATQVRGYLKEVDSSGGTKYVTVQAFKGTATGTAGALFGQCLRRCLNDYDDVEVVESVANYSVDGEYRIDPKDRVVVMSVTVRDGLGNGGPGVDGSVIQRKFFPTADEVAVLLGSTSDTSSTNGSAENREAKIDQLVESARRPNVVVETTDISKPATIVKPSESFPYGVELALRNGDDYSPLPVDQSAQSRGFALVDIDPGREFAVRIENPTDNYVGVEITFDGINVFAFSENQYFRQLGKYAIKPHNQSSYIKGWHHRGPDEYSKHELFSFIVTNYGDSAAARFGATSNLGTMTVVFYECHLTRGSKGVPSNQNAVGLGGKVEAKIDSVPLQFGRMLGAVSVRYSRPAHPVDLPAAEGL